jgi:hypothetical protein
MSKVTMIKSDAVVNVAIGSAFLKKIQKLTVQIVSEKSEEEINKFKELIQDTSLEELPEQWMETLLIVNTLVRAIETEAINSGQTYEQDVNEDDIIGQ